MIKVYPTALDDDDDVNGDDDADEPAAAADGKLTQRGAVIWRSIFSQFVTKDTR